MIIAGIQMWRRNLESDEMDKSFNILIRLAKYPTPIRRKRIRI